MGIWGKILTIAISLLVLGLWPLIFGKFIDQNHADKFSLGQITTNGWWFLGAAFLAIVLNVWMVVSDNNANKEDKERLNQELSDIKKAIEKSNLKYDSASKAIINTGDALLINQGDNISFNNMELNQYHKINVTDILNEGEFLRLLKLEATTQNIQSKEVYLFKVRETNCDKTYEELKKILLGNGYSIKDTGTVGREPKVGVTTHIYNDRIMVAVGDIYYPPLQENTPTDLELQKQLQLIKLIRETAKKNNITNKEVYLLIVKDTNGALGEKEVAHLLKSNSYKVFKTETVDREFKDGVSVEPYNGKVAIVIGNLTPNDWMFKSDQQ